MMQEFIAPLFRRRKVYSHGRDPIDMLDVPVNPQGWYLATKFIALLLRLQRTSFQGEMNLIVVR